MLTLEQLKFFKDSQYCRNLILKSPNMEVLLVCWRPGQGTPLHGHGPSDGVVLILEGEMTNESYLPDGNIETEVFTTGQMIHSPVGTKHVMVNKSDADVVSFHIYAPPLEREIQKADLGIEPESPYDNEVQEMQISTELASFLLGKAHQVKTH